MKNKILSGEITEHVFDTLEPMDNAWSMDYFIKKFDLSEHVTLWDGTYIELENKVCAHSGGRGDFYSHIITFEQL